MLQPRSRGRWGGPERRWWGALAATVFVLAGCGGGSSGSDQPVMEPAPATGGAATTPTLAPPADLVVTTATIPSAAVVPSPAAQADDLAAATAVPPLDGFTELAAGSGVGPLDLDAAADGDARERDALTRFRFRDGYARGFVSGGEEIVVSVLRLASPADAQAYLRDTIDSSLVGNGSFLFAVPVPGATGYREQGAGQDGEPYVTYGALFTRGDRCFEQVVRSPATGPERSEGDAQTLARRQADRVGG